MIEENVEKQSAAGCPNQTVGELFVPTAGKVRWTAVAPNGAG